MGKFRGCFFALAQSLALAAFECKSHAFFPCRLVFTICAESRWIPFAYHRTIGSQPSLIVMLTWKEGKNGGNSLGEKITFTFFPLIFEKMDKLQEGDRDPPSSRKD